MQKHLRQHISNNLKFFYYRALYRKKRLLPPNKKFISNPDKVIKELIDNNEAVLISRLGAVEALSIIEFNIFSSLRKEQITRLHQNTGFYINKEFDLDRFVSLSIDSLKKSNLLAYYDFPGQYILYNDLKLNAKYVTLKSYEPFWTSNNWMSEMRKKNICVVSPFIETMKKQLPNINKIHKNLNMNKHDFSFVLAPQTNGAYNHKASKPDWFHRLNLMKEKILKTNPDLVLIGAGSYGPPLGGILKEIGISSMICGGALQLYFGILGKRWEERSVYSKLINSSWTRLADNEKPNGYKLVEDGCYW